MLSLVAVVFTKGEFNASAVTMSGFKSLVVEVVSPRVVNDNNSPQHKINKKFDKTSWIAD